MSRTNKKFSLLFINNDAKTHAAYKSMMSTVNGCSSTKADESVNVKTAFQQFKNTQMKYPFALSEQRFLWQDNNYKHKNTHSIELTGSTVKKMNIKNSFDGGFESFYDLNQDLHCDKDRNRSVCVKASTRRKNFENVNSSRVMNPKLDKTSGYIDEIPSSKRVMGFSGSSKCIATGGISNLLSKTPECEIKSGKKRSMNSSDTSVNLFSEDYHKAAIPYTKTKKSVDIKRIVTSGKFAGVKSSSMPKNDGFKDSLHNSRVKLISREYTGLLVQAKEQKKPKPQMQSLNKNSTATSTVLGTIKKNTLTTINSANKDTIPHPFYNPINNKINKVNLKKNKANTSMNRAASSYLGDKSTRSNVHDTSKF